MIALGAVWASPVAAQSTAQNPVTQSEAQDCAKLPTPQERALCIQGQAQPAKPQTVKKRVCEQIDENPYSRLGNRKICRTIEVPVTSTNGTSSDRGG